MVALMVQLVWAQMEEHNIKLHKGINAFVLWLKVPRSNCFALNWDLTRVLSGFFIAPTHHCSSQFPAAISTRNRLMRILMNKRACPLVSLECVMEGMDVSGLYYSRQRVALYSRSANYYASVI